MDRKYCRLAAAFKAARLCCPKTRPIIHKLMLSCIFPALDADEAIHELKQELPAYTTAIGAITTTSDTAKSAWRRQEEQPPVTEKDCKTSHGSACFHLRPHATERVFSLLESATSGQRGSLLVDILQLGEVLQYTHTYYASVQFNCAMLYKLNRPP